MRIGIVSGLHLEVAMIAKFNRANNWGSTSPLASATGPGGARAEKIVSQMVAEDVAGIMSFGLAGGLDKDLASGSVLIPEEVRFDRFGTLPTDETWRMQLLALLPDPHNVVTAPLFTSDNMIETVYQKRKLGHLSGARSVDMESALIGRAAGQAGVPFIVVRAVADHAVQKLPHVAKAVREDGTLSIARAIWSLASRPWQIADVKRLSAQTNKAHKSLADLCNAAGPGFGLF